MPMKTALDAPANELDEDDISFIAKVKDHGWTRTSVFEDHEGPGFSFTTGFWLSSNIPEVIVFSLSPQIVHDIFWDLYRDGKPLILPPIGVKDAAVFSKFPAYFFPVSKKYYRQYLGWNRWFYCGDTFPCVQLVWPDSKGTFPWQQGFDEKLLRAQIDLTENGWSTAAPL